MMSIGMDPATARAAEKLSAAMVRQAQANDALAAAAERLAAAIEAHTTLLDYAANGPRG